jgi:glycogen synthase
MPTTIHYVYHLDASRDTVQSGDGATYLSAKASIRRAALCRKALMAQHGTALPDGSLPRLAGRFRFFMPSRPEAYGLVNWEANAFGLP